MKNKRNCDSIERRIHQLLDDRLTLTGDPLLMEHTRSCLQCRRLVADYDEIFVSKEPFSILSVSEPHVWHAGDSEPDHQPVPKGFPQLVALLSSLAAMLLLAVGIWLIPGGKQPMESASFSNSSTARKPLAFSVVTRTGRLTSEKAGNLGPNAPGAASDEQFLRRLVFFQPPTFVELAQNTPTLVNSVRLPTASPSWQEISSHLDPLSSYLQFSAELPGFRNFHSSVCVTLNLLSRSWAKPEEIEPDLGWFPENRPFAAI